MNPLIEKFKVNNLLIKDYKYWVLSLRPIQLTLGSMILTLKRECSGLGDLKSEETMELATIFNEIESNVKQFLRFNKINYLALMMVDDQVHFHVLPRYATEREFCSFKFLDQAWPGPITEFGDGIHDDRLLASLCKKLVLALETVEEKF